MNYPFENILIKTQTGTGTPQKNEPAAPGLMKNLPNTPEFLQSSIMIFRNLVLNRNSQKPEKYPTISIKSISQLSSDHQ